ncbi:lung seven transmembrane receptor-domain-containing protein [Crucibulum laeve]|uniref:Lung seven transmembrane receptor-domain-containing protein n=1 Tax=Crucibulum laeve TaxID=68775 RepID=A0A5C3LWM5_9AGAR|nr:lung seven transmembrane receptor-domain-containing protein [Crucibulum laeve]
MMARSHIPSVLLVLYLSLSFILSVSAFQVPILDTDYSRQICSGMWGGPSTFINVSFDATSQGQLAMVIYEWSDAQYLGKVTSSSTDPEEDYMPKTYVCTSSAVTAGFCSREDLGRFILDLPQGRSINDTSFWSARVELPANKTTRTPEADLSTSGFWNNPAGNPTPPTNNYTSPWRRSESPGIISRRDTINPSPSGILSYTEPIQYLVRKTGYYCVAVIPVTVQSSSTRRAETDVPYHPSYKGVVLFQNKFKGQLPATDHPKVNFYFVMFLVYAAFGTAWGWLCYKHINELLPIQYYLSGLVGLLVIEMVANWGYYRYLNAHGKTAASTVFLIVVAILDAGRNSMSFFMLLVVSLGLSVVRESLGRTMRKCQLLAGAHFIFGILYAIGIVELELESTSALVLLLFIIPLAFTLSGFLLWIMYALNATIAELRARKQRYKLRMFEHLYHILLFAVLVIAAFFVVSSMSFSGRLAEDYAAKSWKLRWWLLDGWLALLYFVAFAAIAFLWRPSENNRRYIHISTLAMSDEIAQDEEDAEDYDLEAIQHRTRVREDDEATLVGARRGGPDSIAEDNVVFEIGDEDDEDDDAAKKRHAQRLSGEAPRGQDSEREGLMGTQGRSHTD